MVHLCQNSDGMSPRQFCNRWLQNCIMLIGSLVGELRMSQQNIEPVRQILIIQAITGWRLGEAKMTFNEASDYANRAEEALD